MSTQAQIKIAAGRLHRVIVAPVVSEKSTRVAEKRNQAVFKVARDATKPEIKAAVEQLFKVQVTDVNTINRQGKRKRTRIGYGQRSNVKRAIVTLRDGDRIDVFGQIG